MRRIAFLLLVAGCAHPAASPNTMTGTTKGAATPSAAVEEFMHAIADSNLTRVGELWGNSNGPVVKTRPKGYEKKIVVMQAMMRGVQATTTGDVPADKDGLRTVTTQLSHNGCRVTIPVNVVKSKDGWLVHDFDLVEASKINQPCETSRRPGN